MMLVALNSESKQQFVLILGKVRRAKPGEPFASPLMTALCHSLPRLVNFLLLFARILAFARARYYHHIELLVSILSGVFPLLTERNPYAP